MSFQYQVLGTIIPSVLNYDQFCDQMGEKPSINNAKSSYVPCDGRSIIGSKLESVTKPGPKQPDRRNHIENAPDLRGKFMRGLNHFYSPGEPEFDHEKNGDPDGMNRPVGSYQPDAMIEHQHSYDRYEAWNIRDMSNDKDQRLCAGQSENKAAQTSDAVIKDQQAGKETRPRNIAVYYYIKIN